MSVSVPLPDELAHRLEVEAARRGMTPAELAAEVIRDHVPVEAAAGEAGDALAAFFGMGDSGAQEVFDIKAIRREAAEGA
ncbi:MAG: CopG family transcriptional regulator [Actinomycetota bacterium]